MTQQSIPASPSYKYAYYNSLKGIDLTADITQVPRYRAADLLNIMPDIETGNPRKRYGWRALYAFGSGVNFLGSRHIVDWGIDLIVTDSAVYYHDSTSTTWDDTTVITLISNTSSVEAGVGFVGFDSDGNYLLNVYLTRYALTYDGSTVTATEVTDSYVPTTIISRNPDGTDGYAYEAVNAFSRKRIISFLGNDTDTTYYFYPSADRSNHYVIGLEEVEIRNSSTGEWETATVTEISSGTTISAYNSASGGTASTYELLTGFTLSAVAEPVVVGQDNVRATVIEFPTDTDENDICYGYYEPIVESILTNGVCARYGLTNMDREFYAANDGRIYYTESDNYNYLPDNNYLQIKVDTPICGFHRKNTYLVAITQDSAEFTVYMITGGTTTVTHTVLNESATSESTTEDIPYFIAKTALAGTGAISKKSFATLVDDALFLSRRGIYGITSNTVTSETVLANRSELINPRLIEESDLDQAVATIWGGMYLLAVNSHVYLLDSRETHANRGVSYGYECYYWDSLTATEFLSYEGNLFFGDASGNWCRLNTDIGNYTAYEDGGTMDDSGNMTGGDTVYCLYSLKLDADGLPQYFKTLNKRGTSIELMQLSNSGVIVSISKDGADAITLADVTLENQFTWTLVDFENFSFNSIGSVRTVYPKKKIKKYKYLQFIFESNTIDQDFGLCGVTKTYYLGNFAKG